jgi:hypothetical protein
MPTPKLTRAELLGSALEVYTEANEHRPHDTVVWTLVLLLDPKAQMSISAEQELVVRFTDGSALIVEAPAESTPANPILYC